MISAVENTFPSISPVGKGIPVGQGWLPCPSLMWGQKEVRTPEGQDRSRVPHSRQHDVLGPVILCSASCPVCPRMFTSALGLYPWDASLTCTPYCDNPKSPQMVSEVPWLAEPLLWSESSFLWGEMLAGKSAFSEQNRRGGCAGIC